MCLQGKMQKQIIVISYNLKLEIWFVKKIVSTMKYLLLSQNPTLILTNT